MPSTSRQRCRMSTIAAAGAAFALSLAVGACSRSDAQYAGSSTQASLSEPAYDGTTSAKSENPYPSAGITRPGAPSEGY